MINSVLRVLSKSLLSLRYRIRVIGIERVARRGTGGILFLPNHPALIDPVIVLTTLMKPFAPRALGDREEIDRPVVRWVARRVGVRPISDLSRSDPGARDQVSAVVNDCAAGLREGENVLLYPAGRIQRSCLEDLRGNSAVESILRQAPDARLVLIRTRGLWGSSFSLAGGEYPSFPANLKRHVWTLVKNLVFLTPRRDVTLELHEPDDFPRAANRNEINHYLERFYNESAPSNTYVPYAFWERGGSRALPDPVLEQGGESSADIPQTTRRLVAGHLTQLLELNDPPRDADRLAQDLGLDSLARAELMVWLGKEFGFHAGDMTSLQTVADVMLAARGQAAAVRAVRLRPIHAAWFAKRRRRTCEIPSGDTITEVFLRQARRAPGRVAVADQISGVRTYRDLITGIFALRGMIRALPGERVGIMLPASVAANVAYLATLFAGRTPVMVNWTTGSRNVAHSLQLCGVERVLTVAPLVSRIESQGTDLGRVKDKLVYLEDLGKRISLPAKLGAWLRSRLSWGALWRVQPPEHAVVLLTSGSEALPKAVPLTHGNILTNIRDVLRIVRLRTDDRMIGFLPPFHSFGLTATLVMPLVGGLPVVYHANPTEAWVLAEMVEKYGTSVLIGTPTFLNGVVRASTAGQLTSLRLAVTGAEKCPESTYAALAQACPGLVILEGYGVTECSPFVAANGDSDPRPFTIGRVLRSLEYAVVDVDTWRSARPNAIGLLLVRGPSVFRGYLGDEVESPFVEFEGRQWYRTGDLVSVAADGVLTFRGRLTRFIKLGGEMISLPAIEAVLQQRYGGEDEDGPTIAIEATLDEHQPEIVLFSTLDLDRPVVNRQIRDGELSALHNVSRVIRVDEIPVLGTGKTNYRALRMMLQTGA